MGGLFVAVFFNGNRGQGRCADSCLFCAFRRVVAALAVVVSDPDNSCDGDEGHRARWPRDGWFWTWARRTAWLVRNTAYGFHIDVLGISVKASDYVAIFGDPKIGDRSGISGWCRWNVYRAAKLIAWQFYFVQHYKIFGVWKCVRLGIGWKCWGVKPFNAQHWLYFHPLKGSGRNG